MMEPRIGGQPRDRAEEEQLVQAIALMDLTQRLRAFKRTRAPGLMKR